MAAAGTCLIAREKDFQVVLLQFFKTGQQLGIDPNLRREVVDTIKWKSILLLFNFLFFSPLFSCT